jgi:hypothetical protein
MESLVRYLNISPNIFKLPGIDMKSLFLNKLKTLCNKIWKEEIVNDSRNNTGDLVSNLLKFGNTNIFNEIASRLVQCSTLKQEMNFISNFSFA